VASSDRSFLDTFTLVVGILIGLAVGIGILAANIATDTRDSSMDAAMTEQILARIEPIGRVVLTGEGGAEVAAPAVVTPQPVAAKMTGPQVYNAACTACHATGVGGAPVLGAADQWGTRIDQGRDTLNVHVLEGYQGELGYMPPKGGRLDLSDEEILAALDFMLEELQ
jgi:cytochrome c5